MRRSGIISEICLRHGGSWQPWRRIGSGGGSEQEAFELEENEAVVAVRTNNSGTYGSLYGLEITTSTGKKKSWGDLDDNYGEKRRSAVGNARLAFCSGAWQTANHGRRITFHWLIE